ncbi:serine hydrolase domain-containing protein [Arthrobacter sp. Ld5]|uniref:serine hydrolase domain-containing protein n=1 Tax=Arthrobacter sp. Ld5 TaxID=649152 RepID=UPI003EB97795
MAIAVASSRRVLIATAGTDAESTFEIGSVSKALTGLLYSDALERGVVSPTTTLGEVLPLDGFGPIAAVSLGSLAVHRSGLPRLAPGMSVLRRSLAFSIRGANPYGETVAELVEQTRGVRVGSPRPRYSNLGFQLLGHATASADGRGYGRLLHEVLGPRYSTPSRQDDLDDADLQGASRLGRLVEPWVGEALAPAGGIRASVSTIGGLLRSILDHTAPGLTALRPVADFSPGVRIGVAWITVPYRGRTITWHNGATGGFSSWIGIDREAGVGVAVLSARHGAVDRPGFRLLEEIATSGSAVLG